MSPWRDVVLLDMRRSKDLLSLFSCSVMSDSLGPHGLQHNRPSCPSLSSGVCLNSFPLNRCCHPTNSSSVVPFFSCLQSFPASSSFPMSQLFTSGSQSFGASASVLPMYIQGWFPLGLTGLISLLSKGLSRIFSSITVQKPQFFGAQPSLYSPNAMLIHYKQKFWGTEHRIWAPCRGRFKREKTRVYLQLIHVDVWQKSTQHCKAVVLWLKIIEAGEAHCFANLPREPVIVNPPYCSGSPSQFPCPSIPRLLIPADCNQSYCFHCICSVCV